MFKFRHLLKTSVLQASNALGKMVADGSYRVVPKGRTFSVQYNLPKLPVPALEQTLQKYLNSCKPLLDDSQYQATEKIVQKFKANEGPRLQSLLEDRTTKHVNWLSDWWKNIAYLECRLPIVSVSPGIIYKRQAYRGQKEQIDFTARCIAGMLDFKSKLDEQSIPVDTLGGKPLCMYQYYTLLAACRIPGIKRDTHNCIQPGEPNQPRHICVLHKNHFFFVDVYGSDDKPLSVRQLKEQLQSCVDQSNVEGLPVGILTSMDRSSWGPLYNQLAIDKTNKATFEAIQQSLTLVCLDGPLPKIDGIEESDLAATVELHGGGSALYSGNRWFDKTIQFIFGPDGYCGMYFEHTTVEGPPIIGLSDHMIQYALNNKNDQNQSSGSASPPKELNFNVNDNVVEIINKAKGEIDSFVDDLMVRSFTFKEYGKKFIKSQKLSPDAFIQIGFQLAYNRMYKQPCATYETGSLRKFQFGRTDTIRSCSQDSSAFTKAMDNNSVSNQEKVELLRKAVAAHRKYTDEVINGQGIDRHLLGLKLIALENSMDIPELFMDLAYKESTHFRLSTSQVAMNHGNFLLFAPVVPDGYGICYNPQENNLMFCVSSFNNSPETDSTKMKDALTASFRDIHDLLASQTKSKL